MTRVAGRSRRKGAKPGPILGAQGEPLSAYPGWDANAGVFRLDGSLADLEERYRRIADQSNEEASPPPAPGEAKGAAPPAQPAAEVRDGEASC